MIRNLTRGLLPLVGALALASTSAAQCPVPDGLDGGPCCTDAQPNFPELPSFNQDALDICWRDCDVDEFQVGRAQWRPFAAVPGAPCSPVLYDVKLRNAAGAVRWRGRMRSQYSRTWLETTPSGAELQVRRYLMNGDMRPTAAAGLTPCPVPPCASDFAGRARYTGYVDYARDCASGERSFAWMLTHSCDVIDHAPNFPRAGFYHPNRSYSFVGPATGFAIGPLQPLASGGTSQEGIRRLDRSAGGQAVTCQYEEQIDAGLEVQQELCICGSPNGPFQYAISDLGLASSCGTSIFSPGGPFLPGYISMGIGSWTDPTRFPGLEVLRWNCGGYDYFDPCEGLTQQEVFFGVTTIGGFAARQLLSIGPGLPLQRSFVDQANSTRRGNGATLMNAKYVSDHILNLNFP